jgi:integrase/recombinase XerD
LQPTPETEDPQMAEVRPLRRRMIEDMTVPNLAQASPQSYIHAVTRFNLVFRCSPDRLGVEEVWRFQLHLVARGISWSGLNQIVCTLRFFHGTTLG